MAVNGGLPGGIVNGSIPQSAITFEDGEHLINPTTGVVHRFSATDRRFHYVGRFDSLAVMRTALERMGLDA